MSFDSEAHAAQALADANNAQYAEPAPVEQATEAAVPDEQVDAGATQEDSFTAIDPSALPPELQTSYKQMQADYTRKTQEAAQYRNLGPLEDTQQAIQLMENLQNPEFQQALYERLGSVFGQADEAPIVDEYGDTEVDDPRDQQLKSLTQRLDEFESTQLRNEVSANLDRMEAVVRTDNPSWDDEDMQIVARFAITENGDLQKGADAYKQFTDRIVKAHIERKASVPAGSGGPGVTSNAQVPTHFESLDEAHDAALAHYQEAFGD